MEGTEYILLQIMVLEEVEEQVPLVQMELQLQVVMEELVYNIQFQEHQHIMLVVVVLDHMQVVLMESEV